MKNLDYKWYIIIGLGIALTISIIVTSIISSTSGRQRDKYDSKIALLNDSINHKEGQLVVYKMGEQELLKQILVRDQEIKALKINIKYLKKRNNEKADSVYTLNDHQSVEFLSNWLSKRDNIR